MRTISSDATWTQRAPRILLPLLVAPLLLCGGVVRADRPPSVAASILTTIDDSGFTGEYSSIQLNASGHPVISYADSANESLMLAVCDDPACQSVTITPVDTDFPSARDTSLALDSNGFPVIAYVASGNGLRLAICEDALCTSKVTRIIDNPAVVDFDASLALTSSDLPVISYYDATAERLRLAVCGDPTCLTSPLSTLDSGNAAGKSNSLTLNAIDAPVVAYTTGENALKVAVCGDASCSSPFLQPLQVASLGGTSVAIGPFGRTFIAHRGGPNGTLDLVVCNDALCTDLGFATVDATQNSGHSPSLVLDRNGFPVISARSTQEGATGLRVAVCDNASCFDPTLTRIGAATDFAFNSLALDAEDTPVMSYFDGDSLELAVCRNCRVPSRETLADLGDVGRFSSLALDSRGFPVVSYEAFATKSLRLATCNDRECSSSTLNTVDDSSAFTGFFTSLVLGDDDIPAISYQDVANSSLRLALCHDPSCSLPPTLRTVDDTSASIGEFSSIVLNGSGLPVISYYDETNTALKVAVCNDATCSAPTRNTVDGSVDMVGSHTSLVLNASGFPVISYYDQTFSNIKVAVCSDAVCTGSTRFDVGFDVAFEGDMRTSLALNSQGFPVVSYHDELSGELRLTVCKDSTCTSREVIVLDEVGDVGRFSSLRLTRDDYPVVSYFGFDEQDLKVAVCHDTLCGDPTLTTVAGLDDVGEWSSMELSSFGFPVISYYAASPADDLRVAILGSPILFRDGFESGSASRWSAEVPPP